MGYEAETEKERKKSDIRTLLEAIITPERCRIEDVEGVVEKCGASVRKYARRKDETRQRLKLTGGLAFFESLFATGVGQPLCARSMGWNGSTKETSAINNAHEDSTPTKTQNRSRRGLRSSPSTTMAMTSETSNPDGARKRQISSQPGCAKTTEVASDTSTSRTPKINQQPLPNTRDNGPHRFTRSDDRERHHHRRRRRRHPKVLWQRERRSSSLGPRRGHRIPRSSLDAGSQPHGGGTSRLRRPHRQCREHFQGAPFHRRVFLEGSKHKFTTSLS